MTNEKRLQIAPQGERELLITRALDAPRDMVFDAWTKPELLKRWLGMRQHPMVVCEIDLKVGGAYRWVWRLNDGSEMGVGGTYREVAKPERLVATEKFDTAWYPGEALVSTVFAVQGGGTLLTMTLQYESRAARDGVLKSPMEHGMSESLTRMDELLASMQVR